MDEWINECKEYFLMTNKDNFDAIQSLSLATIAAQCVCIIMTNGNNEQKLLLFTFHNFS